MHKFKVGDEVIVINDSNYGITTKGSVGIVTEKQTNNEVRITFKTLGKEKRKAHDRDVYYISIYDIALLAPISVQEQVINKIREMEERRKPYAQQFTPTL